MHQRLSNQSEKNYRKHPKIMIIINAADRYPTMACARGNSAMCVCGQQHIEPRVSCACLLSYLSCFGSEGGNCRSPLFSFRSCLSAFSALAADPHPPAMRP